MNTKVIVNNTQTNLIDLSLMLKSGANDLGSAVMLMIAFYFAAPHIANATKVALSKFGKVHSNNK
ncbi:hypothetical protein BAE46_00830 [Glaciecola punicea]|uniref:hypothetical protein n=1 Tax=Glaciecola punicea TaxID=56804 RepID=UPI0008725604|nr:hypothetical protein [Glaciecola punicea]OFA33286.1 hypothetical protein BAE46_00830 [Glaciecola punicea]